MSPVIAFGIQEGFVLICVSPSSNPRHLSNQPCRLLSQVRVVVSGFYKCGICMSDLQRRTKRLGWSVHRVFPPLKSITFLQTDSPYLKVLAPLWHSLIIHEFTVVHPTTSSRFQQNPSFSAIGCAECFHVYAACSRLSSSSEHLH